VKPAIKKITCVFFMGLVFLPLLITLFFGIQRRIIRERMREELETQMLVTIKIPEKEVKWVDDDHEIMVDGYMFDIRTSKLENGVYTFTGLYDHEETALLLREKETRNEAQDNVYSLLVKNLNGLFLDDNTFDLSPFPPARAAFTVFVCRLADWLPAILTPPPRVYTETV
jgi:hypothetical protein